VVNLPSLNGRRAIVTGGNRGIGLAIATGLKALGANVTIGARNAADGKAAAAEIGVSNVVLDVADPKSIAALIDSDSQFDILVNNAGVLPDGSLFANPAGFEECMAVMVHGPFQLIQGVVPHMKARGFGRIINVSSGWGSFSEGLGGPNAYGIAKASLNALTLALSRDMPNGVTINAMCPGWVRTRMGGMSASRSPEEGADTALWLASQGQGGVSGGFFRDRKPIGW
jgi:NAD(P)-dependent dehydrogenase (short-subunit alcohol dehydrogenase family)